MIPHCSAQEIEPQSVGSLLHTCLPLGGAEMAESLQRVEARLGLRSPCLDWHQLSTVASVEMSSSPSGFWSSVQAALCSVFLLSTMRSHHDSWPPLPKSCYCGWMETPTLLPARETMRSELVHRHPLPPPFSLHQEELVKPWGSC